MNQVFQALRRAPVWAVAPLCGLAAGLAHPPTGFLPGLLGHAGLLLLCQSAPSLRDAFWRAWLAGTAYFAVSCWWVFEAFQVDAATFGWMAPFAVALLAGGLALFWGLAGLVFRAGRRDNPLTVVWFAGAFASLEWLRGHLLTGFPWNLPGETWRAGGMMSQSASIVGVYGLTWMTLAIAVTPALLVVNPKRRSSWIATGLAALTLASMAGFGAAYLRSAPDHPGRPVTLRIVQANFPEVDRYPDPLYRTMLDRYAALTAQPSSGGAPPQLVFWPEGALPRSIGEILTDGGPARSAITEALSPGQTLVFGGYDVRGSTEKPIFYNSLIAVRRTVDSLAPVGLYDKHRLVPFGEYMPPFLKALGIEHLVPAPGDFDIGPPPAPLGIGPVTIQPLICYESLFPGFTRHGERLSGRRADLIVNLSNDSWFGATSGPLQNFNLSSYRAIEEGLMMVRSTPNGVSAVIDAHGRPADGRSLGLGAMGVVDVAINTVQFDTAYRRYGDGAFAGMLLISLLALGAIALGRRVRA